MGINLELFVYVCISCIDEIIKEINLDIKEKRFKD